MIAKRLRKQVEQLSHEYQIPNLVLDETDKQILTILHEEGRISYTDLGKRVDLSRVAVQARINQLIEAGVIEKFTAVINPAKIGIHVSVFFNVEVEPQFLEEVALKLASKGQALKRLAKQLNIPLEETAAVGDSLNDKSMLEAAGKGVAMGNAREDIKSIADAVTLTNDEHGVAHMMKHLL